MLDAGEPVCIIDVREPYEAEICSIGGTLIPMGEILDRMHEIPKEGKVVMHCRSGGRSSTVIHVLETEFGYTNLYNLKGGILAWVESVDNSMMSY